MKLYDLKRNTWFRLKETKFPPDYSPELVEELKKRKFQIKKIDGMYSLCVDTKGEIHHPAAWSEVEVIEEGQGELPFD